MVPLVATSRLESVNYGSIEGTWAVSLTTEMSSLFIMFSESFSEYTAIEEFYQ